MPKLPSAVLPKRPPSFIPYIYSREELRCLLDAIPTYRRYRTRVEPETDTGEAATRQAGMDEMSAKFRELGSNVYVEQKPGSTRAKT